MAKILQFIRPDQSFDPETLAILGGAYDRAVGVLPNQSKAIYEVIAGRLIDAGVPGERNPDTLHQIALRGVQ